MKTFSKSDLRSGMKVQTRNGKEFIYMQNPDCKGRDLIYASGGFMPLDNWDSNLLDCRDEEWDAVKVFSCGVNICALISNFKSITWNLIWQRTCDHEYACTKCGEPMPPVSGETSNSAAPVIVEAERPIVRMYCTEDFGSGIWLTKGKTYTIKDGAVEFDDGFKSRGLGGGYKDYNDFKRRNPTLSACLVPLAKRPAKVGEWVLVADARFVPVDHGIPSYKNGDILQIIESESYDSGTDARYKHGCASDARNYFLTLDEYLVLDGYQPSKYEAMTDEELKFAVCNIGSCSSDKRAHKCPLYGISGGCCTSYLQAHPELRQTLIEYLINEDK